MQQKELIPCHKLLFSNPYIFGTHCRKPLIFQTYIIRSNRSHSLKCQRSKTLGSQDKGIRKSEFVTKTQFLYQFSLIQIESKIYGLRDTIHFCYFDFIFSGK